MKKMFAIPLLTLSILSLLLSACAAEVEEAEETLETVGLGPCYPSNILIGRDESFDVDPVFSDKGRAVFREMEKESGFACHFNLGFFDDDSTQKTCRTLNIDFETTKLHKFTDLKMNGKMEELKQRAFATYLEECKNQEAYKEVFLTFVVGKDDTFEEFAAEERFSLAIYQIDLKYE